MKSLSFGKFQKIEQISYKNWIHLSTNRFTFKLIVLKVFSKKSKKKRILLCLQNYKSIPPEKYTENEY